MTHKFQIGLSAIAIALLFSGISVAQKKTDPVTTSLLKIVKAKNEVRGYVSDMKAKFATSPDAPDLAQAKAKYRLALGDYNAWVAIVKSAIMQGKTNDIQADSTYTELAEKAGRESTDFVEYVQSKTGQSKGVIPALSGLADLGLKLWNGIKDRKDKDRKARADQFEKDTTWSQWEDIK
ncbi:MAG: hypothetical protein ACRD6X_21995 [Pyrinomonadaceae bacterium]